MGAEGVKAILDKIKRTATHRVEGIESLVLKSDTSMTTLPKVRTAKNYLACADSLLSRIPPTTPPGRGRGVTPLAYPSSRVTRT
jgi:hypothetical protein